MTTLNTLIDEVAVNLSGYTLQQDKATYLKEAVTTTTSSSAAPTVLSLGSTESLGSGVVEIDEELMYIDQYDRVASTATVSPFGRGYMGSSPATHAADSKVTISPTFPRFAIKRAINDTINSMGATMFVAKLARIDSWNPAQTTYGFTDLNIQNILSIDWQSLGPSKAWNPVRRWDYDNIADPTVWGANAQTVTIMDFVTPGQPVHITYATDPEPFTANDDEFNATTGLPHSCKDIVILGATYRLLANLDPARASMTSPQADETNAKRPFGSSSSATKQIYALYQQRLNEETRRQQLLFPARTHYSR